MITLYGIKNCDTVKKARLWLTANNLDYRFHDFQREGLDVDTLRRWVQLFGYETLLNKRGTTWRQFNETDIMNLNEARAISLMLKNTSVIKRPVLDANGHMRVGFDEAEWSELFKR